MGKSRQFLTVFAAKTGLNGGNGLGWVQLGGTLRVGADDSTLWRGKTITPSGVFFLFASLAVRGAVFFLLLGVCFTASGSRAACRPDMQGAGEADGLVVFSSPSDGRTYLLSKTVMGEWRALERG